MKFKDIHTVYFIGIGGIGMSAIARFFNAIGKTVLGYDKTETQLTELLQEEGALIHFEDKGTKVIDGLNPKHTLVIYTPAIPSDLKEFNAFKSNGFLLIKRAKALGLISAEQKTFAVAGTHGKTTTSSIMAHVLYSTESSCNAFIGGITSNYNSNCLIAEHANRVVVEADEFDRSFLELSPDYSIITSMDADHLDIYGGASALEKSFIDFAQLTSDNGLIMVQSDLDFNAYNGGARIRTYGFESNNADWNGQNLRYINGKAYFDINSDLGAFTKVEFGLPGKHNAENALAVFALLMELGISETQIRDTFKTYLGVKRRFEYHIKTDDLVIIDDYAHHPTEISSFLHSVKEIYPSKKITAVFQPHLFSRTKDFMEDFAKSLAIADQLYLLDIYPARELPIKGITSKVLLSKVELGLKFLSSKKDIVNDLKKADHEVIVIIGAGDIDTCINPIVNVYRYE